MNQLWSKLKSVKMKIKELHKTEFANLHKKIEETRGQLDLVQSQLQSDANDPDLHCQKNHYAAELRKWLSVEEIALMQKSRIQWLKLGDENNQFFFRAMKESYIKNTIDFLYNDQGEKLTEYDDIQR